MPIIAGRASAAYGAGFSRVVTAAFAPVGAFEAISSVTVPSGGVTSVNFVGISNAYSHLQVRMTVRDNYADPSGDIQMLINNQSAPIYAIQTLSGDRATAYGGAETVAAVNRIARSGAANSGTSIFGAGIVDIYDANSNIKNKSVQAFTGVDVNTAGYLSYRSMLCLDLTPVTSLAFSSRYGTSISQYSTISLYGVK